MLTISQAAIRLGVNRSTVYRAAIRHKLGVMVGKQIEFTDAEVEYLRSLVRSESGNPEFTAGNQLWKKWKKRKRKKKRSCEQRKGKS